MSKADISELVTANISGIDRYFKAVFEDYSSVFNSFIYAFCQKNG